MNRSFPFALLCLVGLIPYSARVQAPRDPEKELPSESLPTVVLLGDSIRDNYQNAVGKALEGKANIWSPKDNCRHTAYMLENLDRWLEGQENAQVIHVNVGLHDLYLNAKTGMPRHTLETYEKNLRAIFAKLDELSDAKVIFALTTVVDEKLQAESDMDESCAGMRISKPTTRKRAP